MHIPIDNVIKYTNTDDTVRFNVDKKQCINPLIFDEFLLAAAHSAKRIINTVKGKRKWHLRFP